MSMKFSAFLFILFALTVHDLDAATPRAFADNIVIPQRRVVAPQHHAQVQIERIRARIHIQEQLATTHLDIFLRNPHSRQLEAEVILPIPADSQVRHLDFKGAGTEPSARLLPKDEARSIYDGIVRQLRDPALLEFIDHQLLRSSVFPVPAHGTQQIRISYETVLQQEANRLDYQLPRSYQPNITIPWDIEVQAQHRAGIAHVYSPSHEINSTDNGPQKTITATSISLKNPGPFLLSLSLRQHQQQTSYFAYPDPSINGGYVLILGNAPDIPAEKQMRRCVQMVIDRSGSMHSGKIDQVKQACLQILAGLQDGEYINITMYNEYVDQFSDQVCELNPTSRKRLRAFINSMRPQGGTNIHDAILSSLRQPAPKHSLPLLLFLTDGLATIGKTKETTIRNLADQSNPHNYRLFTIGVGVDVNTPLLQELADRSRGKAHFLGPHAQLETRISHIFNKLQAPSLVGLSYQVSSAEHKPRLHDALPRPLPDLFHQEQLMFLARYEGDTPFTVTFTDQQQRRLSCQIDPQQAKVQHAFVARLWANRHIAELLDAIRENGAELQHAHQDPRNKELIEEIIRLSTQFGILSEYTAFFAREGMVLNDNDLVYNTVRRQIEDRAWNTRNGAGSYNQDLNLNKARESAQAPLGNRYVDKELNEIEIDSVHNIQQEALYKRKDMWVCGSILMQQDQNIDETIAFGSARHLQVARDLAKQGRHQLLSNEGRLLIRYQNKNLAINAAP